MEENKKKKILKITLCTLGLILVLMVGSLAVYNASIPGTALNKLLVSQPDFKFNFTESNTVTMNNPSNNDKQDFNFNVVASSTDTNYMFSIDYTVYLKVNENNTISNDLVYVELYDKNNNKLVDKTKLSDLTKVTGKDNEYILKTNNIQIFNESKTDDFVLRYSYINNTKVNYTKDDTSQTGTYKSSGTFNMTVNVSMDSFEYGKINSLSITTPPSKTEYKEGESFDKTGMVVKANLNNNKSYEIKDYTISPSGALTTSNKEVTISYGGKSVKQSISVVVSGVTATEFAEANVGQNGLDEITHTIDDTLQVDSKFATEYRYRGADDDVYNYIYFNCNDIKDQNDDTCEKWRIVGIIPTEDTNGNVEKRFKIVSNEEKSSNLWNDTMKNDWTTATLNTYLNGEYYNSLVTSAKGIIGTTTYYLGGYNFNSINGIDYIWNLERANSNNAIVYGENPIVQKEANKKLALLYFSDYAYASLSADSCTNFAGECTSDNWIKGHVAGNQLLLNASGTDESSILVVLSSGIYNGWATLESNEDGYMYTYPTLTLKSDVKIMSDDADGSYSNPYRISYN